MLSCQYDLTSTGYDSDWDSGLSDPRISQRNPKLLIKLELAIVNIQDEQVWTEKQDRFHSCVYEMPRFLWPPSSSSLSLASGLWLDRGELKGTVTRSKGSYGFGVEIWVIARVLWLFSYLTISIRYRRLYQSQYMSPPKAWDMVERIPV